ncbi:MAG TPA: hypothetical protein PKD54_13625, partial [Pirellulaceae bacterium]|nr:hypothetical protein [Pirellulaceae bacterium]
MTELVREVRFFWKAHGQFGNSWSGLGAAWEIAPFFCLRATVAGPVAQPSGYLCDIVTIDQRLRLVIERLLSNDEPPQRYDDAMTRISEELVDWRTEPISLRALEWIITPYF